MKKGLSTHVCDLLMDSWRPTSLKQYDTYIRKWRSYCGLHNLDFSSPNIEHVLEFMTECQESGLGYSAMNSLRSALSAILHNFDGHVFGSHPLVKRLMKGAFERKPALPRNQEIWDINLVLQYLKAMDNYDDISLKDLTLKTVMLLALSSDQRRQALQSLKKSGITFKGQACQINFQSKLKTTRPGKHQAPIILRPFEDPSICASTCLHLYITRTEPLRELGNPTYDQLLLSYHKPHKPVSLDTVSRYLKTVLHAAGVDVKYTPHSTRSASTSAALARGTSIDDIMKCAGWSQQSTFLKFYKREAAFAQVNTATASGLL